MSAETPSSIRPAGTRDAEATREALLLSGLEAFASGGYDGATVDRIARGAAVNKAMINYHFGGKAGLYRAILEAEFGWLEERLADLRGAPLDAPSQLRRFVAIFGDLHARHPHLSRMLMREIMSGGRHLDENLLARILQVFATVQFIVEQGVREGAFRPVNPLLTHLTVIGGLVFFFASAPFRERLATSGRLPVEMPSGEDFVRNLQSLMTQGLAPSQENRDA
jgi:AcrR family transcriptional regulator